jgi:membrane protease YdiL (CAAX protease family)
MSSARIVSVLIFSPATEEIVRLAMFALLLSAKWNEITAAVVIGFVFAWAHPIFGVAVWQQALLCVIAVRERYNLTSLISTHVAMNVVAVLQSPRF